MFGKLKITKNGFVVVTQEKSTKVDYTVVNLNHLYLVENEIIEFELKKSDRTDIVGKPIEEEYAIPLKRLTPMEILFSILEKEMEIKNQDFWDKLKKIIFYK